MKGALRQGVGQVAQPSACEGLLECHSNTINSTDAPSEAGALRMVWLQAGSGKGAQMEIEGGSKGGLESAVSRTAEMTKSSSTRSLSSLGESTLELRRTLEAPSSRSEGKPSTSARQPPKSRPKARRTWQSTSSLSDGLPGGPSDGHDVQ